MNTAPPLVVIHASGRGRFTTTIDGKPLVARPTTNPEYGSARELLHRGYRDGPCQFAHEGTDLVASSVMSIYAAAKLTVEDGDRTGLRTVRADATATPRQTMPRTVGIAGLQAETMSG